MPRHDQDHKIVVTLTVQEIDVIVNSLSNNISKIRKMVVEKSPDIPQYMRSALVRNEMISDKLYELTLID